MKPATAASGSYPSPAHFRTPSTYPTSSSSAMPSGPQQSPHIALVKPPSSPLTRSHRSKTKTPPTSLSRLGWPPSTHGLERPTTAPKSSPRASSWPKQSRNPSSAKPAQIRCRWETSSATSDTSENAPPSMAASNGSFSYLLKTGRKAKNPVTAMPYLSFLPILPLYKSSSNKGI